ncbi:TPA: hypothetical protein ACH3X2_009865 [Trebouxia sp. C0005]
MGSLPPSTRYRYHLGVGTAFRPHKWTSWWEALSLVWFVHLYAFMVGFGKAAWGVGLAGGWAAGGNPDKSVSIQSFPWSSPIMSK